MNLSLITVLIITSYRLTGVSELEEIVEEVKPGAVTTVPVAEFANTQNSANPPVTGIEVIPRLIPGTRVQRGPDWKWGDQVTSSYS